MTASPTDRTVDPAAFDVATVRAGYPALAEGLLHFDGPGGTQVPQVVVDAVAGTLASAVSNRHGPFRSSERADAIVDEARGAVADLVGGDPAGVILGPAMTPITFVLADALGATWRSGDEVVVTRLDHDANVRPWVQAAKRAGATVRWAEVEAATGELPVEQYDGLLTERTRLVAVTAASNAIGTRPDVAAIAARAHAVGALVYIDGVHATPHMPVDRVALGADFYACSAYKFYGPHLGAAVADPALLETLRPAKLLPSSDTVPDRFERGTPPFETLAGLTAAVDHLAAAGSGPSRRARLLDAMARTEAYEAAVFAPLLAGLRATDGVTVYGAAARRTPTLAFTVAGWSPRAVAEALGGQGMCLWDGDYYAIELMRVLGLADSGGAVRAGLAHYTTLAEVHALLDAVAEIARSRPASRG